MTITGSSVKNLWKIPPPLSLQFKSVMGECHWRYGSRRLEVHSMSTTALFQWIVHCIATKEMMHLIVNPIQIPFSFSFWLEDPNLQNNLSNLNMPPCQNHKQPGVLSSQLCLLRVPANSLNMSITKKKKKRLYKKFLSYNVFKWQSSHQNLHCFKIASSSPVN